MQIKCIFECDNSKKKIKLDFKWRVYSSEVYTEKTTAAIFYSIITST